LNIKPHLEHS